MSETICPCGSGQSHAECCGLMTPPDAEQVAAREALMAEASALRVRVAHVKREQAAIDDGLPAATQRVMDKMGCDRNAFIALNGSAYCLTHTSGWLSEVNACGYAEGIARAAREDVAETVRRDVVKPGETIYRINSYVEAGTHCSHCGATYHRCTEDVLRDMRDPKSNYGCCDDCEDGSGHTTRYLSQVDGLIAETVREASEKAWFEGVREALNHAVREDDGITLRLSRPNPYAIRAGEQ